MKNVHWKWIGNGPKSFSSFVTTFYGRGNGNGIDNDFEQVKSTFQNEIAKYYNDGYSVILGGEAIDSVLDPSLSNINQSSSSSSSTLLNEIYSILPQRVIEHKEKLLTTLVSYRAPRADHFKSYWKMLLDKSGETNATTTFNLQGYIHYHGYEEIHKVCL